MFSSLFVCLLATLNKNFQTDLHEIFSEGWQWDNEQTIKFSGKVGKRLNFGGNLDHCLDIGILFRIRHY